MERRRARSRAFDSVFSRPRPVAFVTISCASCSSATSICIPSFCGLRSSRRSVSIHSQRCEGLRPISKSSADSTRGWQTGQPSRAHDLGLELTNKDAAGEVTRASTFAARPRHLPVRADCIAVTLRASSNENACHRASQGYLDLEHLMYHPGFSAGLTKEHLPEARRNLRPSRPIPMCGLDTCRRSRFRKSSSGRQSP